MTQTTPSTIALTAASRTKEFLANAALSPGHIMELMSTGRVRKNTRAAKPVPKLIALEMEYGGKGITDAYAADDQVICGVFTSGTEVTLRLPAGAVAVVIGDALETDATGCVRKQVQGALVTSVGTGDGTLADVGGGFGQSVLNNNFKDVADAVNALTPIAIALEAVDNSAGSSEAFIRAILL